MQVLKNILRSYRCYVNVKSGNECDTWFLTSNLITVQYLHSYESKSIRNRLQRWDFDLYVSGFLSQYDKTPRGIVECWIVLIINVNKQVGSDVNGQMQMNKPDIRCCIVSSIIKMIWKRRAKSESNSIAIRESYFGAL